MSSLTFGTDYDQISYWDPVSSTWKHWVNDSDFNDFSTFEYGKTYEIYINAGTSKNLTVTGKSPAFDVTHQIKVGDNFLSPPVKSATAVSTVLAGLTLGTHYSDVKRYNTSTSSFESYAGSAFTQFEPGKGYIIVGLQNTSFDYGETERVTTFVYDSTGSRVKKTEGSTTAIYFGKDYEKEGANTTKHIFLGDRRISTKKYDGSTHTTEYIHGDHINSSNIITDSSGNQSGMLEYDPYGSTVTHTGTANPKHKFTGQEEDDGTGLYYYGARYYDPQLGRFITADWIVQDPADPQSLNRYAYARNNPIKYTDPTGNFWFLALAFIALAAIAGGIVNAIANRNNGSFVKNFLTGAGKAALVATVSTAAAFAAATVAAAAIGAIAVSLGVTATAAATSTTGAIMFGTFNVIQTIGSGVAAGYVGNGVANAMTGENFNQGAGTAMLFGGVLAAAFGARNIVDGFKGAASVQVRAQLARQGLGENSSAKWRNVENPNVDIADDALMAEKIPGGKAPDFVTTPAGESVVIPEGFQGPSPTRTPGMQFTGGSGGRGLNSKVSTIRIMDANRTQGPRVVYENAQPQIIDPKTGKPSMEKGHVALKKWD